MKQGIRRVIAVALTLILLVVFAISASAAKKVTGTQDGLFMSLSTDKEEYAATDLVSVKLQIVNNSETRAHVDTTIELPGGLKVDSGSAVDTGSIEVGGIFDAGKLTLAFDPDSLVKDQQQDTNDEATDLGWILWVVIGAVVVAGGVAGVLLTRKWKSKVSMLLMMAVLLSFVAMATPAQATATESRFELSTKIVIDGNELQIKAVILYDLEEVSVGEEEEDDGKLVAFYYNDFEDPDRAVQDGATLEFGDGQVIDSAVEVNGTNHYGYIEIKNKTSSAYLQADFKNSRPVEHMVMRMELSTGSFVPYYSYLEYRISPTKNTYLLTVGKSGELTIGGKLFEDVKIEKGKWLLLEFVFDFTDPDKDTAELYVNDQKMADLDFPKSEANYALPYLRFTANGNDASGAAVGGSLWLDNIAIYESDKRLPMDQMKSPKIPVGERRTTAPDVEMVHPELSDMGKDAIAVLADCKDAYASEKVVQLSAAAQAVKKNGQIVDVKVPGAFLTEYLGATGLKATQMYSLKDNAGGKNVLVDSRGLVVVSEKKLDAEADIKLLTMVYGYLKTGILAENYAAAPIFTQAVIDDAFATYDVGFNDRSGQSTPAMKNMNAIYYLLLAARMDEKAASSDGVLCKDEAIRRIKNLISGGNEPGATVGCFWAQSVVGNILLLAKNTPSIWNELTAAEHGKMDLLMECLAIASNWGYNADNNYRTGFDMHGNYGKNYNPNFMSAGFVNYLTACMYFGAEKVDEIFVNFDHATYLSRLKAAGFTNILTQWTYTDLFGVSIGEYMTSGGELLFKSTVEYASLQQGQSAGSGVGVKVPWRYQDLQSGVIYDRDDFYLMVFDYLEYCYGLAVISSNGIPGSMTYAYIISGETSPYAGQMGMMSEFSSQDGGDFTRSRCIYSYMSAQVVMGLYANMKLLGAWDYDAQTPEVAKRMREMDSRIQVGTLDLLFKINEGYMGSAQRKNYEEYADEFARDYGLNFIQDLWHNFHDMNVKDGYVEPEAFIEYMQDPAEPMNGITEPSAGALIPSDQDHMGKIHPEMEYEINGKSYSSGTLEFDLVIGDQLRNTFTGNIIVGQSLPMVTQYADHSILIQINEGNIMVYNEDGYDATGLKFGANYRFHFKLDFDCTKKQFDITITQTWPKTTKPVTATLKGLRFRTSGSASCIDTILPVNDYANDPYWLENVTISGTTRPKTDWSPYKDITVKLDWGEVPESERPDSVKVNLVYNNVMLKHKYVVFTAADGWADKVFDNVPVEINKRVPNYTVYQAPVGGYLAVASEIKDDVIVISQTKQPVIFESNFQDGELGKLVDTGDSYGEGKVQFVTEGDNVYLALNDSTKKMQQLGLTVVGMFEDGQLSEYYSMIFFEMDLKKVTADANIGGYALGYRRPKPDNTAGTASQNLVSIVSNKIMGYDGSKYTPLGKLTEEWQRLKVCLDIANNQALISFGGDENYLVLENLPDVMSNTFFMQTWAEQNGLAIDNMKVYCDTSKSFDEVVGNRAEQPVIYESDFQDSDLGKLVDYGESYKEGVAQFVTEGDNVYLALNDSSKKQHQLGLSVLGMFKDGKLNDYFSMLFFEMDLKKASSDSSINGYALGYRRPKADNSAGTAAHNLVTIAENKIMGYDGARYTQIGNLTDQWQTLKVCLDVVNKRALISFGSDDNYLILENLPDVATETFFIQTAANKNGLAIDNMKVYTDASKSFEQVVNDRDVAVNVQVTWKDIDNAEGKRPSALTVKLFADGVQVSSKEVNEAGQWKVTFKDLPNLTADGEVIQYTVTAETENYVASYNGNNITMTITKLDSKTDKNVQIVWDDNNDCFGRRPTQVTVKLLKDNVVVDDMTLVLTAENNWTGSFTGLTKYNIETLKAYEYTVQIESVPYYVAEYEGDTITLKDGEIKADVVVGADSFPD